MDPFLASLPQLPDSAEMRAWDKAAIDFGMPENMLMENAGHAIAAALSDCVGDYDGKRVWLFMGGGNNGGDAACLARLLLAAGSLVTVFCAKPLSELKGAAAFHAGLAQKAGVKFVDCAPKGNAAALAFALAADQGCLPDLIVDGLLGTGFAGELRPDLAHLIAGINFLGKLKPAPVLAIDIPSGLNALSGRPQPVAIKASLTVTLASAKPGLLLPWARAYTGDVVCRRIGIPRQIADERPAAMRLLAGEALTGVQPLPQGSYKNIYGHVLVIGGANGYAGACHLACAGALRMGAGLVTACAPGRNLADIRMGWPEIMTLAASDTADWPQEPGPEIRAAIAAASALVIGPGMGRSEAAAAFLAAALTSPDRPPAVIDADALFALGRRRELLQLLTDQDILTPHPGEAAFLLNSTSAAIQADRLKAIKALAGLAPAAVALKGAGTLLMLAGQPLLLCPYDIPGLAIGGAGDTLAGCIGAVLASRQHATDCALARAAIAVITHAMAGLALEREYGGRGFTASELADALPFAAEFVKKQAKPCAGLMPWPAC